MNGAVMLQILCTNYDTKKCGNGNPAAAQTQKQCLGVLFRFGA